MKRGAIVYDWVLNRIRSIAATVGLYGSVCALSTTLLAVAILWVVALIPLYLNNNASDPVGESYCINNYTLSVGFQIPQYTTTFNDTLPNTAYSFTSTSTPLTTSYLGAGCSSTCTGGCPVVCPGGCTRCTPNTAFINPTFTLTSPTTVGVTESCFYQTISIISPVTPNATVSNNYALSEACYQTLQSCNYDPLLTSCLLSNCIVVALINPPVTPQYPLTTYTLSCAAKIYYKTRCPDSPASYGLNYSSAQQNSVCRQQRLNRINTCLNSTVQLSNVPCLISVSSGMVTNKTGTCYQTVSVTTGPVTDGGPITFQFSVKTPSTTSQTVTATFTSAIFTASDQAVGHVYRISNINSQNYPTTQAGALYCGAATQTQIAAAITTAINSQTSP